MTVSHLNGNAHDNRAENLTWETQKENEARKREHGTKSEGFSHYRAAFSPEDIAYIVQLRKQGKTHKEIAQILEVAPSTISRIFSGKRYREVVLPPDVSDMDLRKKL